MNACKLLRALGVLGLFKQRGHLLDLSYICDALRCRKMLVTGTR